MQTIPGAHPNRSARYPVAVAVAESQSVPAGVGLSEPMPAMR